MNPAASHLPVVGAPLDRVDGPAKVTGRADYATEQPLALNAATGFIVEAEIGAGRIAAVDTTVASLAPGVLLVLTHENAPEQSAYGKPQSANRFAQSKSVLENNRIRHHGLPVALVVAETFEAARHAASLVRVEYEDDGGAHEVEPHRHEAIKPKSLDGGGPPDQSKGKFQPAFEAAQTRLDVTYTTPNQHHMAMEPHATLADWDGRKLTLHMPIQIVAPAVQAIARTLKLPPKKVRVLSPYIGGGFGSKLGTQAEAVLAALASKTLGRPVKVAQTRRQMFANAPHRGEAIQRLRIGAGRTATRRDRPRHDHGDGAHISLRRTRRLADARFLRGPKSSDDAPRRAAGHPAGRFHAGARRGDRLGGARMRDGRACARTRHRSAGASPPQRARPRPGQGDPLRQPRSGALPARGRRQLWLEPKDTPGPVRTETAASSSAPAWRRRSVPTSFSRRMPACGSVATGRRRHSST